MLNYNFRSTSNIINQIATGDKTDRTAAIFCLSLVNMEYENLCMSKF